MLIGYVANFEINECMWKEIILHYYTAYKMLALIFAMYTICIVNEIVSSIDLKKLINIKNFLKKMTKMLHFVKLSRCPTKRGTIYAWLDNG